MQHQRPPRSHQIKRDLSSSPSISIAAPVKRVNNHHHHHQQQQQQQQSQARYSPYGLQSPAGAKRAQVNEHHASVDVAKPFWTPEMMMNHHHQQQHQQQLAAAAAAAAAAVAMGQPTTNELLLPHLTSIFNFKNQLAASSAFKHVANNSYQSDQSYSLNSSSSVNTSSGYATMYTSVGDESSSGAVVVDSAAETSKSIAASAASLAHIMNWIKSTPSVESLKDVTTKIFYATVRWAKTQKNFLSLPASDQNSLLNENLTELFVLQMAESRFFSSELNSLIENEQAADEDKRQLLFSLQNLLQKFHLDKVDPMEFYLLKSIALFKSGNWSFLQLNFFLPQHK